MKRVLITGCNGFVAEYLIKELLKSDNKIEISGCDQHDSIRKKLNIKYYKCDITNFDEVKEVININKPNYVYHLAAISNNVFFERNPIFGYKVNFIGTLNLLESIKSVKKEVGIIVIGSSECYGNVTDKHLINEKYPCNPKRHYGMSKLFAEKLALKYNDNNIKVFCTRSFNHTGPGQKEGFVIPDFAKQVAEISLGKREKVIKVGNLDITRDFLDVRDVVKAYIKIIEKGKDGEIYNVCSGRGVRLDYILQYLINISSVNGIKVEKDFNKMRKIDNPYIVGDNAKLKSLGWQAFYKIEDTLKDVYNYWIEKISK